MSLRFCSFVLILTCACWTSLWGQYTISTFAGNGTAGFSGDSGPATSAQLSFPGGIAVSAKGIYIADGSNNRVRLVANGTITTVAGNGTAGYLGDNAAATSAELQNAVGVAVDSSGNLYIADAENNVIRMVTPSGTITTFAGQNNLGAGYSGDGLAANAAQLNDPVAVAVDSSGNVYIADAANDVIREVTAGIINTIVGGAATAVQLSNPDAIAVDASGNLYIADTDDRRILEFSNGTVTVLAGNASIGFSGDNGPATQAALDDPMGVAVDAAGNVYIADTFNTRVRKITNGVITTIAGTGFLGYFGDGGPGTSGTLYFPRSVAVDSAGNVYIGDTFNNVVRILQPTTPSVPSNGVVNAASYAPQVSPGSLATVFGVNLAASEITAEAPLPLSLGGVSVTVNGKTAPILAVTPTQVNFQVPWETAVGTASIAVTVNGRTSNTLAVPVMAAAPGLFSVGAGRAAVQNSDYSLNTPSNPAQPGGTIMAYLTGSGPVNDPMADGVATPYSPLVSAMSPASATIGAFAAQVTFTGLAPGFVGLVQMNIVVPAGLAAGDYPLSVTIHGQTSNSGLISVTR
jgi:uncharacterized protein (TIGR03437 family)